MRAFFIRFLRDRSGATAIEYGLIVALVCVVMLAALTTFSNTATGIFNTAMDTLREAGGG